MIVFNRSNQTITYSGGNFAPGGKPVHVLPEHQEEVKTLLGKYPRHLSEGGVDSTEARKVIADKDHEISQLNEQLAEALRENENLKLLLTDTPAAAETPADVPADPEPAPAAEAPSRKSRGKQPI